MGTYLELANIAIVKEFYANAMVEEGSISPYIVM